FTNRPVVSGITSIEPIQATAILLCGLVMLFGRGFRNVLVISLMVLIAFIWGYHWYSGGEVNAAVMPILMLLACCFFREREALVVLGPKEAPLRFSPQNGRFYSICLGIVCAYYVYWGLHNLAELNGQQWLDFNGTPLADGLKHGPLIRGLMVPIASLVALSIPLMFVYRRWISVYLFCFIALYWLSGTHGSLLLGNLLIWLTLVPVHRLFQKVSLIWDDECRFCRRWVDRISRIDWLGRIRWIGASEVPDTPEELTKGWSPTIVEDSIWVKGIGSPAGYAGFYAFRRLAWAIPLAWPFLPIVYLPFVPGIGQQIYAWIAKNRHQFGCRIR
ncbi:MAG: hypothetical protein K0Q50_2676, partial [Vampirovibrio sp.]|nr:hypothetical protein [Vampirovibrio sp.]